MSIGKQFKKLSTWLLFVAVVLSLSAYLPIHFYTFSLYESATTKDGLGKLLAVAGPGGFWVLCVLFVMTLLDKVSKETAAAYMLVWAIMDIFIGFLTVIGYCYDFDNLEKPRQPIVRISVGLTLFMTAVILVVNIFCVLKKK